MAKVLCPLHNDVNPSVEVYPNGGFCFVCNRLISLSELGLEAGRPPAPPRPKEDLKASLSVIEALPRGMHRGFNLPYNHRGYYLVWPDKSYYKLRRFNADTGPKYICPSGYKQPLFWVSQYGEDSLMVVEGELDALSVGAVREPGTDTDIVSPGSASNFSNPALLTECLKYPSVVIAVDDDGAGMKAARELAAKLLFKKPYPTHITVIFKSKTRDYNAILTTEGKEALSAEIERQMQEGVCWSSSG